LRQIRSRLTYANVMSTIGVFLLLGTGAAIAAKQVLPKKSVGTKQLKANAVTTAKLKKNAVTKAKIKKDAVDGSKIADGSVTGTEINAASTPFGRIVHEARGNTTASVPGPYLLSNSIYTQEPGRDDTYFGVLDVTFEPSCLPPRIVSAYLVVDAPDPSSPSEENLVGFGYAGDNGGGQVSKRIHMGSYIGAVRFQQANASNHTISIYAMLNCTGGTTGATATFGAVDVIGTK
jgi:hypothetical protein